MRSLLLCTLLAGTFVSLSPRTSLAAWPHSPGVNLAVSTAANGQTLPTIVSDGGGGAIITWMDARAGADDIYAQHVLASGAVDPAWPVNGRALCTAANTQYGPTLVSDGAGGAIVTWQDQRTGTYDIYAQHVLASGAVDPAWPVDGRALCIAANNQQNSTIVSDGAGGAIVTWQDLRSGVTYDIYAQHVLAGGTVDPAWPADGRALCTVANNQQNPTIVSDGAGGAIVTWSDTRSGNDDIYAQHVLAGGTVDLSWPADGRALCTATGNQQVPTLVSDGVGGAIVTWQDPRTGGINDIYAHRVLASGAVDPTWPANGRALCTAANSQNTPVIVTDGNGGAFVTWTDFRSGTNLDIYAQHVLASGAVDGAWPVDGRALCTAALDQTGARIERDASGGAIVTWQDARGGNADVYAQHVLASGAVDPTWPSDGRAVSIATGFQQAPAIALDGAGGAIVAWFDGRAGNSDIYAQRVAPSGYLGSPEPVLASVRDVPNDQGGKVKVSWQASFLDTETPYVVDHYWIFRSAPPSVALAALQRGARLLHAGDDAPAPGEPAYLTFATGYYWEYIASATAAHFTANYSYVAPTTSDSVAASNPRTAFIVVAYDASNSVFFASNPDSGYSADNLAPAAPAPFTGNQASGTTHLHWNPNVETDLAGYRLYRGASAGFVPGPGNQIASLPDTGYADVGSVGSYYKLSAVDAHGNESGYALLTPTATTDVSAGLPAEIALRRPSPNPGSSPTTLHYALPREARVSLMIYDAAGRRVRGLVSGRQSAGEHVLAWDQRDDGGIAVGPGLYFVRLEVEGRMLTQRFVSLSAR